MERFADRNRLQNPQGVGEFNEPRHAEGILQLRHPGDAQPSQEVCVLVQDEAVCRHRARSREVTNARSTESVERHIDARTPSVCEHIGPRQRACL